MNGALFFATRYGSTAQYAAWIADETGLPSIDVSQADSDPSSYDFLIIGAPVFYHVQHVALGGRQDPRDLTRIDRWMLVIGSWFNRDRSAAREEYHGFDFMDRTAIAPIVAFARRYEDEVASPAMPAPASRKSAVPA